MEAARAAEGLRLAAPAKINLYLGVHTGRDGAGYHAVDTVMAALDLADEVLVEPAPALELVCEPLAGLPPEKNAAWRAASALAQALGCEPAVRIHINKRIPVAAGLGGPSTDAAAVLRGCCRLWGVAVADPRVVEVARGIGADVPFFLGGSPAYLGGRGDVPQEEFTLEQAVPIALVKPPAARVSTPAAYGEFDAHPVALPPLEPLLAALRAEGACAGTLAPLVANNLAPAACALEPQVADVLAWLRAQDGALAADVCGSGACSFAICESDAAAARVAAAAEARGWWACATRVCATRARDQDAA